MTKKNKKKLWVVIVLGLLLCAEIALTIILTREQPEVEMQPVDASGPLTISTWDEYLELSLEERDAFFEQFDSEEAFEAWMEAVKPHESMPGSFAWDESGKQPDQYTWEEYQMLSAEAQEAFFQWFDSETAFEAWKESVKPAETTPSIPDWNKTGKLPSEYTWEEYQQLSAKEQDAFYGWFGSKEEFERWMERVKPAETTATIPEWNKPGKLPSEYTWEEYQKLTPEEQDAFYEWFDSKEAFETWMERVKPTETTQSTLEWNKPGKLPSEYTWEEYQKLTPEEQDAFYKWFGSKEAFESWMERVKPAEPTQSTLEWNKPGKLPSEYTWEEYQKLTPEEQDAFFEWFDSVEDFEAWMTAAKKE